MNLTDITIVTPWLIPGSGNTQLTFTLNEMDKTSPFLIKRVTGLDPGEILKTYNDGPQFFRVRPSQRVVSFLLQINPGYTGTTTIGDLRDRLYRLIAYNTQASTWNSDSRLEIRFFDGATYIASLYGFVSVFETDTFSSSSDVVLSIDCPDPYLRSNTRIDLSSTIAYKSRASHVYFNGITYDVESSFSCQDDFSTAPHGFRMECECISVPPELPWPGGGGYDPPKFVVFDSRNPMYYIFSTTLAFQVGDIVHFSSEEDNRYLYVLRGNVRYNLMNAIYWGSIWPFLWPGSNFIEVSEGFQVKEASHRYTYWGV